MRHDILYTPQAIGHLRDLPSHLRAAVLDQVDDQLAYQPDVPTRNRKALRPNPIGPWELRVGDVRVFYDIEPMSDEAEAPRVVILAVGIKTGNRLRVGDEETLL